MVDLYTHRPNYPITRMAGKIAYLIFAGMGIRNLVRFKKSFNVEGKTVEIYFHPVNCIEKQLYQVYIPRDGKPYRIHMQKSGDGAFKIALPDQVPSTIKELESSFEQAILES